jgi:hypothetical protein
MPNTQTSVPAFTAGQVLTAAQMTEVNTGIPVFATTTTRDAAFGGTGEKTLAEGQFAYIEADNSTQYYDGSAWQNIGYQYAIFNETQAANTAGGTATSGSFIKRTLNTTVANTITGCSIASSVITLPAGTYNVSVVAPFVNTWRTKLKLRNTSDSTDTLIGQSDRIDNGGLAVLVGQFTSAASKNYEVQYRCEQGVATVGLGYESNFGVSEIYTIITIEKIA